MQSPINHHYVPKVYLKAFANSQKNIYQAKKKYNKINLKNITQICYAPNYFKINREETFFVNKIKDPYHIEKNSFLKHENQYEKLLKKITYPFLQTFRLSRSDVKMLIEILVTIKRRNPSFKKFLTNSLINYFSSEEFKNDIQPIIQLSKKIDNIDPDEYIKNFMEIMSTDKTKTSDLYLTRFLGEEKRAVETYIEILMKYKFYIYHAPFQTQFITSDNPGYTVIGDSIINYGGLKDEFAFVFPLTPKSCLLIDSLEIDDKYSLDKAIYNKHIDSEIVELFNVSTAKIANENIFAYGKIALQDTMDKINDY